MENLQKYIKNRPPLFAAVGDFVSDNAIKAGLNPDIIIVDNKTLRVETRRVNHKLSELKTSNPPATINASAWQIIINSITLKSKVAIVVEGEEDLLVLPLMAEAPLGSVIIYGQPYEGLVVITLTNERKKWAREFMNRMEEEK